MSKTEKLVIILTRGMDDERSSVAWSIAKGAVANGFDLTMFLVSSGIDWVRKGAADNAHLNPLDPSMKEMIDAVIDGGATVMLCPPCGKMRGYAEDAFIDGVVYAGAAPMLEELKEGAASLTF